MPLPVSLVGCVGGLVKRWFRYNRSQCSGKEERFIRLCTHSHWHMRGNEFEMGSSPLNIPRSNIHVCGNACTPPDTMRHSFMTRTSPEPCAPLVCLLIDPRGACSLLTTRRYADVTPVCRGRDSKCIFRTVPQG